MKEKVIKFIKQIFLTHIGRMGVSAVLMIIGGLMSPNGSIGELIYNVDKGTTAWDVILWIGVGGLTIQGGIMFGYGIRNGIQRLREKFKK